MIGQAHLVSSSTLKSNLICIGSEWRDAKTISRNQNLEPSVVCAWFFFFFYLFLNIQDVLLFKGFLCEGDGEGPDYGEDPVKHLIWLLSLACEDENKKSIMFLTSSHA